MMTVPAPEMKTPPLQMSGEGKHLAQFNIARLRHPLEDPRMKEFADNVERINGLAEKIEGFVWRLQDESGHAMNMRVYGDPRILPNLTVWKSVEALERFVFKTAHNRFYMRREAWFEPLDLPLVLWWVAPGERPSLDEGVRRLDLLKAKGASEDAFLWENVATASVSKTARGQRVSEHAA
jgi:hypothetical protein